MSRKKIISPEYVPLLAEELRRHKRILVFTNGIFDLLHPGHIQYLDTARNLGTYLMVALNTDDSARKIKGNTRPVNTLDARLEVLAAMECVDFVTWFAEDTPEAIIRLAHPDVLVKGGDWQPDQIVGREFVESYGGQVRSIPFIPGYSTTNIIERILQTA